MIETVDSLVGGSKDTDVWARLERVKKAIEGYKGSVLCTTLGNAFIRPPVMRTNAITKNVDLMACLTLWQFIESYDKAGYEVNVSDTAQRPDDSYIEDIYGLTAMNYMASSDETVSSGNVKSTGSANSLLFEERCRRTVFCSVHLQRADGKCTKKPGTLKHAIPGVQQRCRKTGIEFKRNGHQSIYR